jgi:hypothetical protein
MFSGSTKTLADINQRYASVCQDKVFYPNKTFLDLLLEVFDQDQLDFVTGERQPGSGFRLGRNQQVSNFKTQLLSMCTLKAIDAQDLVSLLEAFQQIKETENWKVFRTFENNFLLEGFYSLHAYAAAISNLQPVNPKHKKDLNSDIERLSEIEEEIIAGSDSAKIEPTVPLDTLLGFDKNQSALSPALKALRRTLIEADFIAVCLSEKAGQKMRLLNKAVAVEIAGIFFR